MDPAFSDLAFMILTKLQENFNRTFEQTPRALKLISIIYKWWFVQKLLLKISWIGLIDLLCCSSLPGVPSYFGFVQETHKGELRREMYETTSVYDLPQAWLIWFVSLGQPVLTKLDSIYVCGGQEASQLEARRAWRDQNVFREWD